MPIDIMMGRPECDEDVDELDYVQELQKRPEDAYDVPREHLNLVQSGRRGMMSERMNNHIN